MNKDEKGLEVEDPCGGVQKYMSSEEMDELRRTSRTVCHRLRCCHRLAGLRFGGFLRFSTLSSLRQAKIN